MISICTLLKKGPKYGTEDVNNVFRGLKKHTTKPFKFYCYTDYDTEFLDEDINIIKLEKNDKKLQWYKLDFFKKDIIKEEDIILMDIDQVITNNIDELINFPVSDNEFISYGTWWPQKIKVQGGFYKFKSGSLN